MISPIIKPLLRQIAAYPNYSILLLVNNIPNNLDETTLYNLANFINIHFKSLINEDKKINYDDLIKYYNKYHQLYPSASNQ